MESVRTDGLAFAGLPALLRSAMVWAFGVSLTILAFFTIFLFSPFDRSRDLLHGVGRLWSRGILLISGVTVKITGLENLPEGKPLILASNHQGAFDIPVLQGTLPVQFRWVAKQSLFRIPFIGWSMSLAGYIGIERENPAEAYRSMEEAAGKIKGGTSVLIFPEGTRSSTGALLPFKRGAFMLAKEAGVPVVPIVVKGTNEIMKKGGFLIKPREIEVTVLKPIDPEGLDEKKLRNFTRNAIQSFLKERQNTLDG